MLENNAMLATVEGLSRTHRAALIRYFVRRGVAGTDAEDAAQEVFARMAKRQGVAQIERPDAYLFETAASVAVDFFRRAQVRQRGAHDPYVEATHGRTDFSPHDILEWREGLRLVLIGLKELPERTRYIFLLVRLENMKQYEVARRLNMSLSAVEKNLQRAIAHLSAKTGRNL